MAKRDSVVEYAALEHSARVRMVLDAYKQVDEEKLWENLAYFLERVVRRPQSLVFIDVA